MSTPSPSVRNIPSSKPRILILDRFYFPDEQATSVYLTELTQALQDDFEFEILCGPPSVVTEKENIGPSSFPLPLGERAAQQSPQGVRVRGVPCLQFPKRFLFARVINDLSFLLAALSRGLFVKRPGLLVSQTSPPGVWWVGFLLSRWHRCRWIHICKDLFPDNLRILSGGRNLFFFSLLDRLNSFFLKKADRIMVIGKDMKKKFLSKGLSSRQIVRTCDWVDLKFIRAAAQKNSFSEKYQVADKFVVLYAGNFGRTQNFEDILDTAETLRPHPEIIFLLVGEGAVKEWIIRQCLFRELTNVRVAPFESRSRLPEVLAAADVSVILLRKGMAGLSMPSKVYSILASARPILACVEEESDIARITREAQAGFVIPPGNPKEFVKAIIALLQNPDLKRRLGENARRFAEARDFQAQALLDYKRTFREVLAGP